MHKFCVVDMSSFYLDIIKDRLYCEKSEGKLRLSAQSAIYEILNTMVRLIAPILAFTSNEIWLSMPHGKNETESHIMLCDMPAAKADRFFDEEKTQRWNLVSALRDDVNKALELARADKTIGKPLEASVTLYLDEEAKERFGKISDMPLSTIFIVSEVNVVYGKGEGNRGESFDGVTVKIAPCTAPKCVRCWTHSHTVGESTEHPELCSRCVSVLS
ncbi:MAG: class I tRNA ligase family protein [Clostridiales bacterium]|nr:class I tRNA ligase family protein [Clostridiales bacterium]